MRLPRSSRDGILAADTARCRDGCGTEPVSLFDKINCASRKPRLAAANPAADLVVDAART
jgi:hypothetical protein